MNYLINYFFNYPSLSLKLKQETELFFNAHSERKQSNPGQYLPQIHRRHMAVNRLALID